MIAHDAPDAWLKRTPLYEQHQALGARLVEFGGWEMPIQYRSILEEHRAVRTHAGLFDVSHMGELQVEGLGAGSFLQYLVPNDVSRLTLGQALYTQLCLPTGNIIDDLLIYRLADKRYMLVVNGANIEKDSAWVTQQAKYFEDVYVLDQSEATALLALQGPVAQTILQGCTESDLKSIRYYHAEAGTVAGVDCIISRTGYTGEDGFELYCPAGAVSDLWNTLLVVGQPYGLLPAGLGARDTLRLEAGLCLYGHELDEQTNPLQANLGWTVKLQKGAFIGRDVLLNVKQQGVIRKLVGIEVQERGVPRGGYTIYDNDQRIGILTSGAFAPTVQKGIGMGYVETTYAIAGRQVQIDIRGRRIAAQIVALPFYKRK